MRTIKMLAVGLILSLWGVVAHAGTHHYYYTDPQGTVLAKADASGHIIATYDYAPYGSQALGSPTDGPGYTGHVNDADTGLVYMQARYYDPSTGRFLSVDPVIPEVGNLFNFNRYDYADNNPVVNTDPNGENCNRNSESCEQDSCNLACKEAKDEARRQREDEAYGNSIIRLPSDDKSHDAKGASKNKDTSNVLKTSVILPVFKMPDRMPIFRKSLRKIFLKKIDDFITNQIVKKVSFHTIKISPKGFEEPTPIAFGFYIIFHSSGLGGCDSSGRCADEVQVPVVKNKK